MLQIALRPLATVGIALASAAVLLVNPVSAPLPDIRVAAPAVQPTSAFSDLFAHSSGSLGDLLPVLAADPMPVLSQILANNVQRTTSALGPTVDIVVGAGGYVLRLPVTAVEAIQALFAADGGVDAAVGALGRPLASLSGDTDRLSAAIVAAIQDPLRNMANAVGTLNPTNIAILGVTNISPMIASMVATANAVNAVLDATTLGGTVNALVDFIPTIADGYLNGADLGTRTIDVPQELPALLAEVLPGVDPDLVLPSSIPNVVLHVRIGGLLSTGTFDVDLGDTPTANLEVPGPIAGGNYYLRKVAEAIGAAPKKPAPETPVPAVTSASAVAGEETAIAPADVAKPQGAPSIWGNGLRRIKSGGDNTAAAAGQAAGSDKSGVGSRKKGVGSIGKSRATAAAGTSSKERSG